MNHRLHFALIAAIGGAGGLLAGCGSKSDVSLTGNTPAQYSHVWITVQAVWFNTSGTAGPDDSGWDKFSLSTPSTVDLVAQSGGNISGIASGLRVPARTYSQVRLIPVDATAPLASSAQNAGALYNFEADWVDSAGTTHQLPLELLNPDKGIGIPTSIKVPIGNVSSALTGTGTSTTSGALPFAASSGTTTNPFGTTTSTTSPVTSTTTGSTSTTPNNAFAAALDGTVNLMPFTFASSSNGILWSAHATAAYDLSIAGGISGQLSLTNITTSVSGLPDIRVSAETLSTDGSRHVVVSSTAVLSDGSFLLYPLATNSSTTSPLTYDVVIHGPDIATIIIKGVQVPRPSSSSNTTTTASTTTLATQNASVSSPTLTTTTTTPTTNSSVNAVSIGTLTPRAAALSPAPTNYPANISTAPGAQLPAGAVTNFYQTLGTQGEVPYVIESSPIDPFNQVLFNPQPLSVGTVDSGSWQTNGTVTVVSAAPLEGVGTYLVAASSPGFSDGPLSLKNYSVSQPKSGTAMVVIPALTLESGASPGSLAAAVVATTPGKYDQGQLLLSHDGALVAAAPLDGVLAQGTGGIVTVPGLPAGTPDAVYYATVRAWKSSDPSSVQRQWYPQVIDLRTSTSGTIALTVN
jgi:hypothetical protein